MATVRGHAVEHLQRRATTGAPGDRATPMNEVPPLQVPFSGVIQTGDTLQFSAPGLNSAATVTFSVRGEPGTAPTQML